MAEDKADILIVEDDFYIRDLYERELTRSGYKVRTAGSVKEAFEALTKAKPHLIMLDLMLPIRSGFEVLDKVKSDQELQGVKVVILSNLGEDAVIKQGFTKGADGYLIKASHTPKQVLVEIERYLEE